MTDRNRNIQVMGIVNLTDDSYFAQSRCPSVKAALRRIETLLSEGADIIDIGACSTRPGSEQVGEDVEWSRLEPVLREVAVSFPNAVISVDTYWSSVVKKTYDLIGDFIVNDISAGEADPAMLRTVGESGLSYVAMHMRGMPENMQMLTNYKSVTRDVVSYFKSFSQKAAENGISRWILDPGFGFAKTLDQNYTLLSELEQMRTITCADGTIPRILIGLSRKSMIYRRFSITPEESLPATQVLHYRALQKGTDILRVHDVAEARRTVELYRELG